MAEPTDKHAAKSESNKRLNAAALWALLLALAALAANFVFFVNPPLRRTLPWLSLLFAGAAMVALAMALWRAYACPAIYRGKILVTVLSLISLIVAAANIFIFVHARALPNSDSAAQVGQRVPDFALPDTTGQSVALDSLFASADPSSPPPKAVLLIFYRGYW